MAFQINFCGFFFALIVAFFIQTSTAKQDGTVHITQPKPLQNVANFPQDESSYDQRLIKMTKKMNETVMAIQAIQKPDSLLDQTVRVNFLNTLFLMANASAITGTRMSLAAGTLIRGFVQDSFNLVSIGAYLPRLIFLDGPTQFIEILRLVRANQIRIPQDIDEAMDTLINFASVVRESQITTNVATPFLSFFPNVFRGAELLSTEVLYSVFSWLAPLNPADISAVSVEGLWNRWDTKSSTTARTTLAQRFQAIQAPIK